MLYLKILLTFADTQRKAAAPVLKVR